MIFYSLLHLENAEKSAMNVRIASFEQQVILYLSNALTLSKSLKMYGISFKLITNNLKLINTIIKNEQHNLDIVEIEMEDYITKGLPFYSAHYKLEAYRYISSKASSYAIFCDLDIIAVNDVPLILKNYAANGTSLYYDITSQVVPVFSPEKIISDLTLLINRPSEGRWAGGEFIAGQPEFFLKLVKVIEEILPTYLANVRNLHHIGDEAYTSAALEILRIRGEYISDAGTLGIVQRFWCSHTKHKQANFNKYKEVFLLHLPSSKKLLALASKHDLLINNFNFLFEIYLFIKLPSKLIKTLLFKFCKSNK
jgi:hypothetical protein